MKKIKTLRLNTNLVDSFDSYLSSLNIKRSKAFQCLIQFFIKEQERGGELLKQLIIEKPAILGTEQANKKPYSFNVENEQYAKFKECTGNISPERVTEYLIAYYLQLPDDVKLNIMI